MIKSTKAHPRLFSRLGALSLLIVALVFGASAAPASAAVHQGWLSSYSTANYVALGDSFTAGQGAAPYLDETCYQSKYTSYPIISATFSRYKLVANKSCSSATTGDVQGQVSSLLGSGLNLNSVKLVTLTVGGIDAGSNQLLGACAAPGSTPEGCNAAIITLAGQLPSLLPALAGTYVAAANAMPSAKIVVLNYPHLFNTDVSVLGNAVNDATDALNVVIAGAVTYAESHGAPKVQLVDVTQEFANHGIGASIPYISFDPTNLYAPANFHPNALGNSFGYFRALVNDSVLK